MELMFHDYWWLQLWKFVKEFLGSCDVCACAKKIRHCPHVLLQPLLILASPWSSISSWIFQDLIHLIPSGGGSSHENGSFYSLPQINSSIIP
jgi:hypothetical protein